MKKPPPRKAATIRREMSKLIRQWHKLWLELRDANYFRYSSTNDEFLHDRGVVSQWYLIGHTDGVNAERHRKESGFYR